MNVGFDWVRLGKELDAWAGKRGLSKRALSRQLGIATHSLLRVERGDGISCENLAVILLTLKKPFSRYVVQE